MITLSNDQTITISTGGSRKSVNWQPEQILLSQFYERLHEPKRGSETIEEYLALPKSQQDEKKDVGGFVGGRLNGTRRMAKAVVDRCLITLDADNVPKDSVQIIKEKLDSYDYGYCIYSTRKHRPSNPRIRILIPLDRAINTDEYGAISRKAAEFIGMDYMDSTTFEAHRLMYWPSCSADSEFVFLYKDAPPLQADQFLMNYTLLGMDWHDISSWPKHPKEERIQSSAKKQADPDTKSGPIGAFCHCYDFYRVRDEILPDTYEETAIENRYSYTGGSTTGGATVYDNGKFLQSYHDTDPANGMHNMFDVVRLHKYGNLDEAALPGTPTSQLPSYKAALEYVKSLPDVHEELQRETAEEAKAAFLPFANAGGVDDDACEQLASYEGKNISLPIVKTTLRACGFTVKMNLITGVMEIGGLSKVYSSGNSLNTIPIILKDVLKSINVKGANDDAIVGYLNVIADEHRYNPVCDMMENTVYDGTERLSYVFTVLGVTDPFYQTLIRKWLIQCVMMAHNRDEDPKTAEGVLTLQGPQGIGKTEFFRRLSIFPPWFAEGVSLDMSNKDSVIRSISSWICELGELDSTTKREQSALKGHLTAATDKIRVPYGRAATQNPRRTSFCATVNPDTFLTDPTGNRRYWVIPIQKINLEALLHLDAAWFKQLWAEVYQMWLADPDGYRLTKDEREELINRNKQFETFLPGEEEIRQLLRIGLETMPVDTWTALTASQLKQRMTWAGDRSNISPQQIGRALNRIREDFPDIKRLEYPHKLVKYLLPIPAEIDEKITS